MIRCSLGIHNWGLWGEPYHRNIWYPQPTGVIEDVRCQDRKCYRCGKIEYRTVK